MHRKNYPPDLELEEEETDFVVSYQSTVPVSHEMSVINEPLAPNCLLLHHTLVSIIKGSIEMQKVRYMHLFDY